MLRTVSEYLRLENKEISTLWSIFITTKQEDRYIKQLLLLTLFHVNWGFGHFLKRVVGKKIMVLCHGVMEGHGGLQRVMEGHRGWSWRVTEGSHKGLWRVAEGGQLGSWRVVTEGH